MQKTVLDPGPSDLDPIGEHEGPLEGTRGDATMKKDAAFVGVLGLAPADDELAVLERDRQVGLAKPGDGQGNAEAVFRGLLDIERGIAVISRFRGALHQAFKLIEAQKEGMCGKGQFAHLRHVLGSSDTWQGPGFGDPVQDMVCLTSGGKRSATRKAFRRSPELLWSVSVQSRLEKTDMNAHFEMDDIEVMQVRLGVLRQEHRDLDEAIHALEISGRSDQLTLRRLKKQKLMLKDQIARIEDILTPDIIA